MKIINIVQIVVSALLITTILLQQKGSGLSSVFGGEGGIYRTKRGFEKGLHYSTILLSVLFILVALLNIIIR